jgi:hypothetical protein
MPAARIDVGIALNRGSSSDVSGVGSLAAADKSKTYSRDFTGPDGVPHNEYAPFYDAYIPAASRPGDASSGVDGGLANNFPGFLVDGEYHCWDVAAGGRRASPRSPAIRSSRSTTPRRRPTR